jgi:hypothetical protein
MNVKDLLTYCLVAAAVAQRRVVQLGVDYMVAAVHTEKVGVGHTRPGHSHMLALDKVQHQSQARSTTFLLQPIVNPISQS